MLDSESRFTAGAGHGLITALAAWLRFETSSLIGLKEGYWAAISAIVVLQGDLATTKNTARDRFIGTALGGLIGWGCAEYWHQHVWIYAFAVALIVFVCWAGNIGNAGRLAAVTVTLIVLIPHEEPVWRIALFRFLEVSWGIAVAVTLVMLMSRFAKRTPNSAT